MRTEFSPAQLADPDIIAADAILRKCVHCGMCMTGCPTYTLLGNELDGPRGRIYLIKDMLENDRPAGPVEVKHIDRCLSCLSCMTTCPSGVNYMHLVDHARAHIQKTFTRPWPERALRLILKTVLPYPAVFRFALRAAALARPFAAVAPGRLTGRLKGMIAMAPQNIPPASWSAAPKTHKAHGNARRRFVLMTGCAQQVLRPAINEATIRLLTRRGCEVVTPKDQGCCGALVHHMGFEKDAHAAAKRNIAAWERIAAENGGLDAVVINASGCGTTVKDYGWMLRNDPAWAERAARISALAKDVTEVLTELGPDADKSPGKSPSESAGKPSKKPAEPLPVVAYHSACSMQHGQRITDAPKDLLRAAGFEVREPAEAHLCCGSAGTYNITQPEIAGQLKARKAARLNETGAAVIATGNIGCLTQLSGAAAAPAVHTVELLDWAGGGPKPPGLNTGLNMGLNTGLNSGENP
ncbi:MAG: glycolate oxidase subunit GlcF [Rhodospirillales bacterium]